MTYIVRSDSTSKNENLALWVQPPEQQEAAICAHAAKTGLRARAPDISLYIAEQAVHMC